MVQERGKHGWRRPLCYDEMIAVDREGLGANLLADASLENALRNWRERTWERIFENAMN
jgi:hypothetical protein